MPMLIYFLAWVFVGFSMVAAGFQGLLAALLLLLLISAALLVTGIVTAVVMRWRFVSLITLGLLFDHEC